MYTIGCQFSGRPNVYQYKVDPALVCATFDDLEGARVVVPAAKLKDDGSLSLSIATVVEISNDHPDAVLPVVAILPRLKLAQATEIVKGLPV